VKQKVQNLTVNDNIKNALLLAGVIGFFGSLFRGYGFEEALQNGAGAIAIVAVVYLLPHFGAMVGLVFTKYSIRGRTSKLNSFGYSLPMIGGQATKSEVVIPDYAYFQVNDRIIKAELLKLFLLIGEGDGFGRQNFRNNAKFKRLSSNTDNDWGLCKIILFAVNKESEKVDYPLIIANGNKIELLVGWVVAYDIICVTLYRPPTRKINGGLFFRSPGPPAFANLRGLRRGRQNDNEVNNE
jgi:hypothetical protein